MISKQRRACAAAPSGQPPPGSTGPVPETSTRSPTLSARLNPMVGSNGEPEETPCRSATAESSHPEAWGPDTAGTIGRHRRFGWV